MCNTCTNHQVNVASNLIISEPNLYSFVKVIEGVHSSAHGKMACGECTLAMLQCTCLLLCSLCEDILQLEIKVRIVSLSINCYCISFMRGHPATGKCALFHYVFVTV